MATQARMQPIIDMLTARGWTQTEPPKAAKPKRGIRFNMPTLRFFDSELYAVVGSEATFFYTVKDGEMQILPPGPVMTRDHVAVAYLLEKIEPPMPTRQQWNMVLALLLKLDNAFHWGETGADRPEKSLRDYDRLGNEVHFLIRDELDLRCTSSNADNDDDAQKTREADQAERDAFDAWQSGSMPETRYREAMARIEGARQSDLIGWLKAWDDSVALENIRDDAERALTPQAFREFEEVAARLSRIDQVLREAGQ